MALLEMREASLVRDGIEIVPPSTLQLDEGEQRAVDCGSAARASAFALLAAGLVTVTGGRLFVAAFDPRIQPVQVKRLTGYVPHDAVTHGFRSFVRYVEYRAALWGLPRAQSIVRARALLERLDGVHEAFAYPLVGALLHQPALLVLDRPQHVYAPQIRTAAGTAAILSTHADGNDAQRFTQAVPVSA